MTDETFELNSDLPPKRRRVARDPRPRFQEDKSAQLDPVRGCPELQVPDDHLAREVKLMVELLDLGAVENKYSALGRRGFAPKSQLAVWIYGSLIGVHSSNRLATQLKTDAALQFLSGGHLISSGTLRRFRNQNAELFADAISQSVALAEQWGLLDLDEGAVDSVRLRAHASTSSARTVKRSKQRLEQLQTQDTSAYGRDELDRYNAKVKKHEDALAACAEAERTNIVVTNPSAGLLKFPNGAAAPGHRVTVTAFGASKRIVASVLIDADGADQGKLGGAIEQLQEDLKKAGVDVSRPLRVTADAGYSAMSDLTYAMENQEAVDLLVAQPKYTRYNPKSGKGLFTKDVFKLGEDGATCPAGTPMQGPENDGPGRIRYRGVGCEVCPMKTQCTKSKQKVLVIRPALEEARSHMHARMAQPGAKERYNKRIATIEPVFSMIEHTMGYRRVGTRDDEGIRAEILLKVLAYNLSRLTSAYQDSSLTLLQIVF